MGWSVVVGFSISRVQSIWSSGQANLFSCCRSRSSCDPRTGNPGPAVPATANVSFPSSITSVSQGFVSAGRMSKYLAIFTVLLLCQLSAAQFGGFFEQMFQGEHPGRQQRQRPPGADHWRAQADAGESLHAPTGDVAHSLPAASSLLNVPLPRYPRLCRQAGTMPLPQRGGYQMYNP